MASIRVRDLNERRPDYEFVLLTGCVISTGVAIAFFFVWGDAYRVTGRIQNLAELGGIGIVCSAIALLCLAALLRTMRQGRALVFEPGPRTYEVRTGRAVLGTGRFDDFAQVRLERKTRRVYGERGIRHREFWTVSLVWKNVDRSPLCLQEFAGMSVPPPARYIRPNLLGQLRAAQRALDRWANEFGVPALDATDDPVKDDK